MPIELHWSAETPNLFAASTKVTASPARIFLIGEAKANGDWSWASWSRNGRHRSLHGHASTREAAMWKAKLAANAIHRTLVDEAA